MVLKIIKNNLIRRYKIPHKAGWYDLYDKYGKWVLSGTTRNLNFQIKDFHKRKIFKKFKYIKFDVYD